MKGEGYWMATPRHDPVRVLLGELVLLLDARVPDDSRTWTVGNRPATPAEIALVRAVTDDQWEGAEGLLALDLELSHGRWARAFECLASERIRAALDER